MAQDDSGNQLNFDFGPIDEIQGQVLEKRTEGSVSNLDAPQDSNMESSLHSGKAKNKTKNTRNKTKSENKSVLETNGSNNPLINRINPNLDINNQNVSETINQISKEKLNNDSTKGLDILNRVGQQTKQNYSTPVSSTIQEAKKVSDNVKKQTKESEKNTPGSMSALNPNGVIGSIGQSSSLNGGTSRPWYMKMQDTLDDIRGDIKRIIDLIGHQKGGHNAAAVNGSMPEGKDSPLGGLLGLGAAALGALLGTYFGPIVNTVKALLNSQHSSPKPGPSQKPKPSPEPEPEKTDKFGDIKERLGLLSTASRAVRASRKADIAEKKVVDLVEKSNATNNTNKPDMDAIKSVTQARREATNARTIANQLAKEAALKPSPGNKLIENLSGAAGKAKEIIQSGASNVSRVAKAVSGPLSSIGKFVGGKFSPFIKVAGAAISAIGYLRVAKHGISAYSNFKNGDTLGGISEALKGIGTAMQFRIAGTGLAARALKLGGLELFFSGRAVSDAGNIVEGYKNKDAKKIQAGESSVSKNLNIVGAAATGAGIGSIIPFVGTVAGGVIGAGAMWTGQNWDKVKNPKVDLENIKKEAKPFTDFFNTFFKEVSNDLNKEKIRTTDAAPKAATSAKVSNVNHSNQTNNVSYVTNINVNRVDATSADAAKKTLAQVLKIQAQQTANFQRAQEQNSNLGNRFGTTNTAMNNAATLIPSGVV